MRQTAKSGWNCRSDFCWVLLIIRLIRHESLSQLMLLDGLFDGGPLQRERERERERSLSSEQAKTTTPFGLQTPFEASERQWHTRIRGLTLALLL